MKLSIFKEKMLIALFVALLAVSGCGQSDNPHTEAVDNPISEDIPISIAESDGAKEEDDADKLAESSPEPSRIPVNTNAEDIYFNTEDGLNPLFAIHRCKSDGQNIYLVCGDPYLYVMPIGADEYSLANMDNPEGMNICHIAIDSYGRIHLIAADRNYDKWYIWLLDEEFQIDKVIDITAYFEVKQMPHWFLVDKSGAYYLQWVISRDGIIVDSEGELKHSFTLKSLETKWTYEAATGRDGQVYLVYHDGDEKLKIGTFDMENCSIDRADSSLWFSYDETFSEMSYGTDTALLLFSPYSGVWAYDRDNAVLENRVPISDIDFGSDTEFWPLTFLPDGRLLLLGKAGNDTCFKYLPAGK